MNDYRNIPELALNSFFNYIASVMDGFNGFLWRHIEMKFDKPLVPGCPGSQVMIPNAPFFHRKNSS